MFKQFRKRKFDPIKALCERDEILSREINEILEIVESQNEAIETLQESVNTLQKLYNYSIETI